MWRKAKRPLQIVVSILLLGGLLLFVDIQDTLETLKGAEVSLLLVALSITLLNRCLMGAKWWLLLRVKGIDEPVHQAVGIYFVSSFLGLYMPPTIGADAVRAYYVAHRGNSLKDAVSSILAERLLGLISVLLFALCGTILMLQYYAYPTDGLGTVAIVIGALSILTTAGLFVSLNPRFKDIVHHLSLMPRGRPKALAAKLYRLYESYYSFRGHSATLLLFFLLTCLEVCLPIVRAYIVAVSLGLSVSLLYFFAFVPIILIIIRLPISIDGFGLQEGGFLYFLALTGVSEDAAFSVGLLSHLLFLLALLPGGILYVFALPGRAVPGARQP